MFEKAGNPQGIPEVFVDRHERAEALDEFVATSGLGDQLTTPEGREAFMDTLDGATFIDLAQQINGVLTDREPSEALFADRMQILCDMSRLDSPATVVAPPEDKARLLRAVAATTKAGRYTYLKPLTLATGIIAIHPFGEANGRTARALYFLLSNDYKPGSPGLHAVLEDDGDEVLPLNVDMSMNLIYGQLRRQQGTHDITGPMPADQVPVLTPFQVNPTFNFLDYQPRNRDHNEDVAVGLFAVLVRDDYLPTMLPHLLSERYPSAATRKSTIYHNGQKYFSIDEFLLEATTEDIEHVYSLYKVITRQCIQLLARTMANINDEAKPTAVYVNEGNGVATGPIPEIIYDLVEKNLTPNKAVYDSIREA